LAICWKNFGSLYFTRGLSRKNTFSENPYIMDKKEICGPLESARRYGKKGEREWEIGKVGNI
jgi:hypothetical protein